MYLHSLSHRSITLLAAAVATLAFAPAAQAQKEWTLEPDLAITEGPAPVTFLAASADTQAVAFSTTDRLTAADQDAKEDLYVRRGSSTDLLTPSTNPAGGSAPEFDPDSVKVLPNGAVLFRSSNRIAGDTDSAPDLFLQTAPGSTPVEISDPGGLGDLAVPSDPIVSENGGAIAFTTTADLLPEDTQSGVPDVYLWHDDQLTLVTKGNLQGTVTGLSTTGGRVFFESGSDEGGLFPDNDAGAVDLFSIPYPFTISPATSPTYAAATGGETGPMFAGTSPSTRYVYLRSREMFNGVPADGDYRLFLSDFDQTPYALETLDPGDANTPEQPVFLRGCDDGSVLFLTKKRLWYGDPNNAPDVYRLWGNTMEQVTDTVAATTDLTVLATTADCQGVLWATRAQERPADTDNATDLYYSTGFTGPTLVSAVPAGGTDGAVQLPDGPPQTLGSTFLFTTTQKLAGEDTDGGAADVYEWEKRTGDLSFVTAADPDDPTPQTLAAGSADGTQAVVETTADLPSGDMDGNGANNLFRYSLVEVPGPVCMCGPPPAPPVVVDPPATVNPPAPRPPAAPAPAARPQLTFTTKGLKVTRSARTTAIATRIRVACPAGATASCTVTFAAKAGRKAYASRKVIIKPGKSATLSITLSSKALRQLKKAKRLKLAFTITAGRAGGADVRKAFSATLRAP